VRSRAMTHGNLKREKANQMANELQFYDAAKAALAQAVAVDEVKQIHDKAAAIKAASKIAKDKDMEVKAAEIRKRAKRRLGELMKEQKKKVGFNKGGGDQKSDHRVSKKPDDPVTLAEAGIDKNLAHAARTEAAKSPDQFEQDVATEKERITAPKPKLVTVKSKEPKAVLGLTDQCVDKVRATIEDTVQQMQRGRAPKAKFDHLFAALNDVIGDLETQASARFEQNEAAEESAEKRRAYNAAHIANEAVS
jgi:hypothetical protein